MLYIIILLFAMIIIKLSAAKLPNAPTAAAARATGQQRPRTNRAQTADGRTAPTDQEGSDSRKPGQDTPRPNATPESCRRTADDQRGKLSTAPPRRSYQHASARNDAPRASCRRWKDQERPRIIPKISPIQSPFLHFPSRFFNFSRFFLDFSPSRSRFRLDFSPSGVPIFSNFLDLATQNADFTASTTLPQLSYNYSHNSHRFFAPRPSCQFHHFML